MNNDRHNTSNRPYFASQNLGIGPDFWIFDSRVARRFALRERASVEAMFEAFNLSA